MARQKVVLQPPITITGTTTQSGIDALKVGNNRTGVVFADVYAYGGTPYTIIIETISEEANASGQFSWIQVGTITIGSAASARTTPAITDLGELIRWRVSSAPGTNTLKLIVFFSDQN